MDEKLVSGLAIIIVGGILSQYLAWRFRWPAILLLLLVGILTGPVTGIVDPPAMFGDLLFPIVSLSVAIILFEGGLSLKFADVHGNLRTIWSLVTVGAALTWILSSLAAWKILHLDLSLAVLLGAILVVTGPTVIIPLLRHVRLNPKLSSICKWEGIIIDPIGALLAVLVYEAIITDSNHHILAGSFFNLLKTIVVGSAIGAFGAALIIRGLKKHWFPDFLQNSLVLMIVLGTFVASNLIQPESGLFEVTLMGIILANQKSVSLERIIRFKEDLGVLLLSILFILLSARLRPEELRQIDTSMLLFLAALIFVIRPAAVLVSTIGSQLKFRERLFLSTMAPRGIVAAAVASIFALKLLRNGYDQAAQLMPAAFIVIIGTVTFYGLTAAPFARLLHVIQPHPEGVLILGAHHWAQRIARALQQIPIPILLVDNNWSKVNHARMEGLPVIYGSIASLQVLEEAETSGIGRLLALTYNHEINSLAVMRFQSIFESRQVYQLPLPQSRQEKESAHLRGRIVFDANTTYDYLNRRLTAGAVIKRTNLTREFSYTDFRTRYGPSAVPLFLLDENRKLHFFTAEHNLEPQPGHTLFSLVDPADDDK